MAVYIWSDLHLRHKNILQYENRPFSSVEEMERTLLSNWRKTVASNDTLINLGDVWFGPKEECSKIIHNLPGKKILILGNHDRAHSLQWWRDVGFDEVYPYPILYDEFYLLSHEPLYINSSMPYANVYGHIHNRSFDDIQSMNVSVEKLGYSPISWEEVKTRIKRVEVFSNETV